MTTARIPLIIGNWKLNPGPDLAVDLAVSCARIAGSAGVEVGVAVPFPYLPGVAHAASGSRLRIGVQDVSTHESGAYTGEVSAAMIAAWGSFAIAGHSERRQYHGESDEAVAAKVRVLLAHGLTAVACVGETFAERDTGRAAPVVSRQLAAIVDGIDPNLASLLVVAYEPVWAIGTGVSAQPDDAAAMADTIRNGLDGLGPGAESIRILYGGSVNAANSGDYLGLPGIDGALVGGASLQPDAFAAIVQSAMPNLS